MKKILSFALGTDHAGYNFKEAIKDHLHNLGHETKDFGTFSEDSVDYPEFVLPAAKAVADSLVDYAIVLGGSGNGEAMAANKIKGIRCAVCWSAETAKLAKEHNNANVIAIGERQITKDLAIEIIDVWLSSEFQGERHARRIQMLDSL
ncbi:MAG: ribose 5-phosphate isomerase B [Verrucomicrobiota bacterium]|nr:ribose 5-phosphate isomerase B [Verrucomicrobiota bacterium]